MRAYAYTQYADDDDILAFFDTYNGLAQSYVDWFNAINLPVYTGDLIAGLLLDWVAGGLYGFTRPVLPLSVPRTVGPFNTYTLNNIALNARRVIRPSAFVVLNDDFFKRVMTWHLYLGDGRAFCKPWLKRRLARFLAGTNGTDLVNVDAEAIGVVISKRVVTITLTVGEDRALAAEVLAAAILAGAVEMPFQFSYVVKIVFTAPSRVTLSNAGTLLSPIDQATLISPIDQATLISPIDRAPFTSA